MRKKTQAEKRVKRDGELTIMRSISRVRIDPTVQLVISPKKKKSKTQL